ncbi:hypothetical protein LLG46_10510 [bacterium]|nr:hypothetical protein [bacterium]
MLRLTLLLTIVCLCNTQAQAVQSFKHKCYSAEFSNGEFRYLSRSSRNADFKYAFHSLQLGAKRIIFKGDPEVKTAHDAVCYYYGNIISESYSALDKGVEQTWVINYKPKSIGDVIIEGEIYSPHTPRTSPFGIIFTDKNGHVALTYGRVTVIDSAGKKFACLPQISGNSLKICIPYNFISSAKFPIQVDPVVGNETLVCPTYGAAPGTQESMSIAAGSNGYLAVWSDTRGPDDSDIFGCRISSSGEIIDVLGIPISTSSGKQLTPDVAWNGTEYLVVWADRRNSLQHIYGCRVRPNGEVLDPQGILLSGSTANQYYPKVASDMSSWLVVWQDTISTSLDVYGCKVNSDGTISRRYGISTTANNDEMPDVAYNGTNYIVVWRDYRNYSSSNTDIYGCRVSRLGVRLTGDVLISCTSTGSTGAPGIQMNPRICGMGTTCMVVWEDYRNSDDESDVYGARVSSAASVLDKGGIAISTQSGDEEMPCVEYNGSRLLALWRAKGSDRTMRGARLDTSGTVLDASGIAISTGMAGATCGCAAGLNSSFVAGWSSFSVTDSDALTTLVTNGGSVQNAAGNTTSMALDDENDYSVADNGSEYAVVWSQSVNGSCDIMAARISHDGEPLCDEPVNITSTYYGDQVEPSIAWNGTKYLVVWSGNETYSSTEWDIRGWFLDSNLNKLSISPFSISVASEDQADPCATSNGTSFFVAWEDSRSAVSPNYYTDIYGAVVSSSGTVTNATICTSTGSQLNPYTASNGTNYFVVWEDYRSSARIYGTRVTSSGTVQDSGGIAMPQITYSETTPSVCYGGGNYFVTWSDINRISGCRVSTTGSALDTSGLCIDSGTKTKSKPSACWDGSIYRVVWEDYRSSDSANSDIYYTTVDSTGVVSSSPKIALVSNLIPQLAPRIFYSGSQGFMTYSRLYNYSDGVCAVTLQDQAAQEVDTIAEAKSLSAGTTVSLADKAVTGAFSGYFYIEDLDRVSGIRVISDAAITRDSLVNVIGPISISDGERQIICTELYNLGTTDDPPAPLGIRGDYLGGAALNAQTPGITGAYGANNIGLLATTWGEVTSTSSTYFYIESRSGTTIRVTSGSLSEPAVGDYVSVTGIVSCELISGAVCRAILPREQDDIVVY